MLTGKVEYSNINFLSDTKRINLITLKKGKTMIVKCGIDAVHPTLRRVIKNNITPEEMAETLADLTDNGYSISDIECTQRFIYEEGDKICIKLATIQRIGRKCRDTRERMAIKSSTNALKSMFGTPLPNEMYATVVHKRQNRHYGLAYLNWEIPLDGIVYNKTNASILHVFGYEFAEPKFEYIPLDKADDDMLNDEERVIKYLMQEKGIDEPAARYYMEPVFAAMNKAECVMYRP